MVLLLAPFAPYLAAELWEELGEEGAVLRAPWPVSNPELAKEDEIGNSGVQINGKLVTVVRKLSRTPVRRIWKLPLSRTKR